ncbi:MAG: hypothetical protein K2P59_11115 [Acetatifactor sp.]|nr:hypothetical protein [Acetatifactor sp.]
MKEEKKSRYTDAQAKAAKKYLKESVEDIRIRVPKGDKSKVQEHASSMGESMNAFVVRAINETMERDNPQENIPHTKPDQSDADLGTASHNAFEERREHLLKQYEAMASTAGKGAPSSHTDPRHVKASSDPVTSPGETFEEKMERLRREHGCSRMT